MTDETTITTSTDSTTTASAEDLIRVVASRIGMSDNDETLEKLCDNMKAQFLKEEWQLSALDSYQWQLLGAPIGLAAAIRQLLNTAAAAAAAAAAIPPDSMPANTPVLPSILTSSKKVAASSSRISMTGFVDQPRKSTMALKRWSSLANAVQEQQQQQEEEEEEEDIEQPIKEESHLRNKTTKTIFTGEPPHCIMSLGKSLREFPNHRPGSRSFPMTDTFQQALIHSKTGADLKAHTCFVMELSVLASALLLGAAVELWGVFPMDAVADHPTDGEPYVPRTLALVFHFMSCLSLILQLLCTSGWIWTLHATAAVSPHKFHKFLLQVRYPFSNFLKFSEMGIVVFVGNICCLFGGMIASTTTNSILRQVGYYIPFVFLFAGCGLVHNFTSYIGRVAFHGLLMTDEPPDDGVCDGEHQGVAQRAEHDLQTSFQCESLLEEQDVLDQYHRLTNRGCAADASYSADVPNIFDFMFPNTSATRKQEPNKKTTTTTTTTMEETPKNK